MASEANKALACRIEEIWKKQNLKVIDVVYSSKFGDGHALRDERHAQRKFADIPPTEKPFAVTGVECTAL